MPRLPGDGTLEAGKGQGPVWAPRALILDRKKGPLNELRAEQMVSRKGVGVWEAWYWSWEEREHRDSSEPHPHSPFLSGDICRLTLVPPPPTRY